MSKKVTTQDVLKAAERLKNVVNHTPLIYSVNLSEQFGARIYLKREDLQVVRSFKLRGAYNSISARPSEELQKGVVCASAGNHAQGVAFSCRQLKIKGAIFMPVTTPKQKVNSVKMFGKEFVDVKLVGDTFDDAYRESIEYCTRNNMVFIHPFDDARVIAGQGTVAVEVLEDLKEPIDYVFATIGGGGLMSGLITYLKDKSPATKLIGVEPAGAASMTASFKEGHVVALDQIDKFVDGAAVKKVGDLTYEICNGNLDEVVAVPEGKVCSSIIQLYNEEAIVVEPAGALAVAALDFCKEKIKGKTIVVIVSGGNNDLARMQEIKERSLIYEGLQHYFMINFPQRAGALKEFVSEVLGPNDDITLFEYTKKNMKEDGPALVGVELKDPSDYQQLLDRMASHNIKYIVVNENQTLFNFLV